MDIDKTLTIGDNKDYSLVSPNTLVINKVREYKEKGFEYYQIVSNKIKI